METTKKVKTKPKSKQKPKKSTSSKKKDSVKKIPKLKFWMMENGVNQKDLSKTTELSSNTINRLVNSGKASKSVIKLVSYELGISLEELNDLLKDSEPIKKSKI